MPVIREALSYGPSTPGVGQENSNPALVHPRKRKENPLLFNSPDDNGGCSCSIWRRGWLWACVIAAVVICISVPLALKAQSDRDNAPDDPTAPQQTAQPLPGGPLAVAGLGGSRGDSSVPEWVLSDANFTCADMQGDLPVASPGRGAPPPALALKDEKLVLNGTATQARLYGLNWFGFNNGQSMVGSLDVGSDPSWEVNDFATVATSLRLLGFNAVRLPFSFVDLYELGPRDMSMACGSAVSARTVADRATDPKLAPAPGSPNRTMVDPGEGVPGICNSYLPGGSTVARYLWVVQYLVSSGFYVVVAHHPQASDPTTKSASTLAGAWLRLWGGLSCLPNWQRDLRGRVLLDLLNEPDAFGIGWDGSSADDVEPLGKFYLSAIDAIEAHSPGEALYLIQGGGQEALGVSWGDGFATNATWVEARALDDPTFFFTSLLQRPARARVVLAPHAYPPSLTNSSDVGPAQWQKYTVSWGGLQQRGFCDRVGTCQRFPVVVGEMGSRLEATGDRAYYDALSAYMAGDSNTLGYPHQAVRGWFWWAYNHDARGTGGLVTEGGALEWPKLRYLIKTFGLQPWYGEVPTP